MAEIDGAAEGAGVDAHDLFAASIEEIWSVRPSQVTAGVVVDGRCSDLVAGPPATADGHLWVAHTNDLSPASRDDVVAIEWRVPDEPVVFPLGIGPWISIGWNSAGLSLTGNELSPNDEVVGVPRLLMVREQLTARSMDEAVGMALRPDRASSYNTVFATADGGFTNVEGSATDAEVEALDARGRFAHTNHYACARMTGYEGDPAYAQRSAVRLARARELLATAPDGSIDAAWLRGALADHETTPVDLPPPGAGLAGRDRVLVRRRRDRRRRPLRARQPVRRRRGAVRLRLTDEGHAEQEPAEAVEEDPGQGQRADHGSERTGHEAEPADPEERQRRPDGQRQAAPSIDRREPDDHDAEPGVGEPHDDRDRIEPAARSRPARSRRAG